MTESLHIVTHKNNIKCTSYQIESNFATDQQNFKSQTTYFALQQMKVN